jgi:MOSC domain-containing protein YiiM
MPRLLSIQVSLPHRIDPSVAPDPGGHAWTTGFFKEPVAGGVHLGTTNLDGDGQADLKNHGGRDKAVLCYAASHYALWREELGRPDLPYGAFGENFTLDGLDEASVCIGDVYTAGSARVEVSQPRQPCWKIEARWQLPGLTARVERTGRTGWYVRVLEEGEVESGVAFELLERPCPEWTIEKATQVMRRRTNRRGAGALAEVPALAESWRLRLRERSQAGVA